jgi:hemolysin III
MTRDSVDDMDNGGRAVLRPAYLYDAERRLRYEKPLLRGRLHALCFIAAVVVGVLLVGSLRGAGAIATGSTYAVSVAGLFGVSALYHRGNWSARAAARMQRLDHVMIVILIAGSATPPLALSLRGDIRTACLVGLWALALSAIALRVLRMAASERLVGSVYVGLGWIAGAAVPVVWLTHGVAPALLLLIGGLLYTAGAVGYHLRRPDPAPMYFGYHEVFHTYVAAAAAVQYVAIACLLY